MSLFQKPKPQEWKPSPIQRRTVRRILEEPGLAVLLPPGLGKTSIAYAALRLLKQAKIVKRALIISPLRPLYFSWPAENDKWGFDLKLAMLHGPKKLQELHRRDADAWLINPEGIDWLECHSRDMPKFDMLIVDESSKFRNTNSKRFKSIRRMLNRFDRRYIMTGTPAPNGLLNLFGQIFIVDGGIALGKYITHYRAEFFAPIGYGGYTWVPTNDAAEQIYARIKPISVAIDEKDYIDLPELVEPAPTEIDLPRDVRKLYDELEEELFARLEDGTPINAKNAGVLTMKLRQVSNGGLYVNENQARNLHYEKADAVVDLVDELEGQPAIVCYEFKHDLDRLLERLPKDTPWIGGGVTLKRQTEIIAAWNRGDIAVLLGQPQSMALGLNMQKTGRAVIWHSLTWDAENYDQMIRRVWRQGQKYPVFNYRIIAKNTVDADMISAISRKLKTQSDLICALKEGVMRRRKK